MPIDLSDIVENEKVVPYVAEALRQLYNRNTTGLLTSG